MADDDFLAREAERLTPKGIAVLEQALDKEHEYGITCRYCKKTARYPFPDVRAVTDALKFLNDYGKGKPAQKRVAPAEAKAKETRLEELSDDELLALIGGEDGEVVGGAAGEAA